MILAGWLLVGVLLRCGPAGMSESIRFLAQDAGGRLIDALGTFRMNRTGASEPGGQEAQTQVAQLTATSRALSAELAQLRRENEQLRSTAWVDSTTPAPLASGRPVDVRIVGGQGARESGGARWLVAAGRQQGLAGDELVLAGPGILIEHGTDLGLKPDQLAFAGRSLVGRTRQVGRWTSLVQPLTDPEFRTAARIVRNSALGPVQGPAGILAGSATGCRLNEVPATEAVAVGDDVLTDPLTSPAGVSLYCGKVSRVDLATSAEHWTIEVTPAFARGETPREARIIRAELGPAVTAQQ